MSCNASRRGGGGISRKPGPKNKALPASAASEARLPRGGGGAGGAEARGGVGRKETNTSRKLSRDQAKLIGGDQVLASLKPDPQDFRPVPSELSVHPLRWKGVGRVLLPKTPEG